MNILGFAGSLRKRSWNKKLLHHAAEMLRAQGHRVTEFDLADLPLMNEDLEADGFPPAVADFRDAMQAADALVIATPEYNHSVSGPTKNALDWLSRPPQNLLAGKVAAIMGATIGSFGTVNAQRELRWILARLACLTIPWPWVTVSRAEKHFDRSGNLTDESQLAHLQELMRKLVEVAQKLA